MQKNDVVLALDSPQFSQWGVEGESLKVLVKLPPGLVAVADRSAAADLSRRAHVDRHRVDNPRLQAMTAL
jgi:hypothetical protein